MGTEDERLFQTHLHYKKEKDFIKQLKRSLIKTWISKETSL